MMTMTKRKIELRLQDAGPALTSRRPDGPNGGYYHTYGWLAGVAGFGGVVFANGQVYLYPVGAYTCVSDVDPEYAGSWVGQADVVLTEWMALSFGELWTLIRQWAAEFPEIGLVS